MGKMILLPRLFGGYRGIFPAAPVESAPMGVSLFWTTRYWYLLGLWWANWIFGGI